MAREPQDALHAQHAPSSALCRRVGPSRAATLAVVLYVVALCGGGGHTRTAALPPASPSAWEALLGLGIGISPASAAEDQKPTVKTFGLPEDFDDACEKGIHCVNKGSMETAVWYFREGLARFGATSRDGWGFAMYWMGIALNAQGKSDEALKVGEERYKRLPDPASLALLASSAFRCGDLELAKSYVRLYDNNITKWKDTKAYGAGGEFDSLRTSLETRTYRITWEMSADQLKDRRRIGFPFPQSDLPYQKVVKVSFEGARSYEEKSDDELGYRYYDVVLIPGKSMSMTVEFVQRPYSYRARLAEYSDKPIPNDLSVYLGKTVLFDKLFINPDGDIASKLSATFRGKSPIESIENIFRWGLNNFDFHKAILPTENNWQDSEICLKYLAGHCEGIASAYVALARGCGVPARLVRGNNFGGDAVMGGQHTIPEFYIGSIGWIPCAPGGPLWVPPMTFIPKTYYAATRREEEIPWKLLGLSEQVGCNGIGRVIERHMD